MKLNLTGLRGLFVCLVCVTGVVTVCWKNNPVNREGGGARGGEGAAPPPGFVENQYPGAGGGSSSGAVMNEREGEGLRLIAVRRNESVPAVFGDRLSPLRSGLNPHADRGRVALLSVEGVSSWRGALAGKHIQIPSMDGESVEAVVSLRVEDRGWIRLGGELQGVRGVFSLNTNAREVFGHVLFPDLHMAYQIETQPSGEVVMVERPLEALMCVRYQPPATLPQQLPVEAAVGATVAQGAAVPVINTRPGARGVVFLDFDGARVTDPAWNGGNLISALPATLTPDQIRAVVDAVAEDFAPFDLTITTSQAAYDAAPVGRRMCVIITPTTTAAPGSGGVAYVDSWSQAGRRFSSTVPCWVFNNSVKAAADAVSHEVGHTMGLYHDGSTRAGEYYSGHGGDLSVSTSWGPIMGAPFSRSVTQWSKGEYAGANNTQDDLYVISRDQNGFGYRVDAGAGGGLVDAVRSLAVAGGSFDVMGLVRRSDLVEMHQFSTGGGTLSASVRPQADRASNADLRLELRNSDGATLAFSSPSATLAASVERSLPAGTYWLVVAAAGTEERPAGGFVSGYSAYGSLGAYRLTGTLSNAVATPLLPPSGKASAVVGELFQYALSLPEGVKVEGKPEPLPPGILFDQTRSVFLGTPTEAGVWSVRIGIANANARAEGVLQISVESTLISLSQGIDESRGLLTSVAAPWTGVLMKRADGTQGPVATSGLVADGSSSAVRFVARGPAVMSFWWKVSSEASKDWLQCSVNGGSASSTEGVPLRISGETDWVSVRVDLPLSGRNVVEFRYAKDGAVRAGSDRGWVYGVQVQPNPPRFRVQPRPVVVARATDVLRLVAEVLDAIRYEWKRNGETVFDERGSSHQISGAKSAELCISGATAADSGDYQLVVTNASGTTVSRSVRVEVAAPPVLTQPLVAPSGLRVGETLRLSAVFSGAGPMEYAWYKDGKLAAKTKVPALETPTAGGKAAGAYKVVASNRYGSASSSEVQVRLK